MKNSNQSIWGRMVRFMDKTSDEELKKRAKMLLSQYNTAGGRRIEGELENFLENYE